MVDLKNKKIKTKKSKKLNNMGNNKKTVKNKKFFKKKKNNLKFGSFNNILAKYSDKANTPLSSHCSVFNILSSNVWSISVLHHTKY